LDSFPSIELRHSIELHQCLAAYRYPTAAQGKVSTAAARTAARKAARKAAHMDDTADTAVARMDDMAVARMDDTAARMDDTAAVPVDGMPVGGTPVGGMPVGGMPVDGTAHMDLA
jgi:septal ring factor EnvC (AmiA/AmiB activator)